MNLKRKVKRTKNYQNWKSKLCRNHESHIEQNHRYSHYQELKELSWILRYRRY